MKRENLISLRGNKFFTINASLSFLPYNFLFSSKIRFLIYGVWRYMCVSSDGERMSLRCWKYSINHIIYSNFKHLKSHIKRVFEYRQVFKLSGSKKRTKNNFTPSAIILSDSISLPISFSYCRRVWNSNID